jgi:uncharacterized protein (TIGR02145 family)
MSWKFGSIDFATYGVMVARSQGVLNLPSSQLEGTNWLDNDGREYWQSQTKYNDRDIILNCWMSAYPTELQTGYQVFQGKLASFLDAVKLEGKETLETPFVNFENCSIDATISIKREVNYVSHLQVATFTIRIKVHGDPKLRGLLVNRGGHPVGTLYYGPDAKIVKNLQGEQYFTCTSEQNVTSTFKRGDSITVDLTPGYDSEPYYLERDPEIKKLSSNKFQVNYRFVVEHKKIDNVQFVNLTGESDFYWFANLQEVITRLILNVDRVYPNLIFSDGGIPATERRNHKFSGESCIQALTRMVSEYNFEYSFRYQDPVWELTIATRIERNWPYTLKYGRGEGLYELTRQSINKEELCTVLYAFGSERNIKATYRGGLRRLSFSGNPLSKNTETYGTIEKTVFFDDIYPQRSGSLSEYYQVLKPDLTEQQKLTWPNGIYRAADSSLDFDINQYLTGNLTAKIRMKTGACAGYEFEIQRYDAETKHMFIIPFEDETGYVVPNVTIKPASGDLYTLVDIEQPESYVADAEAELQVAAQIYIDEYSVPKVTYRVVVDPAFMQNNFVGIEEYRGFNTGDVIGVIDVDLGLIDLLRVADLTKNYYTGGYELTLAENRLLTAREALNLRISRLERAARDTRSQEVETMRRNDPTTSEVINRSFSPIDNKQDTDKTVRNESIDARMLGYDAGVPQFTINGLIVETNYEDEENRVKVTAGKVIILNWAPLTKDRYEIWKMQQADEKYDPSRTWEIDETIIDLETSAGYFLYVKLPRNEESTTGTLIVDVENIYIKDDLDYIIYMLGYINAPASPRVATMLWGNIKPGVRRFLELLDVYAPDGYTGQDGKIPVVDESNNRLILVDPPIVAGQNAIGDIIYLHQNDSDIDDYLQALMLNPDEAEYTISAEAFEGEEAFQSFATDVGYPGSTVIPGGMWLFETWVALTDAAGMNYLIIRVYKRNIAEDEELLFEVGSALNSETVKKYDINSEQEDITLEDADRLVFKYYFYTTAESNTATLYIEGVENYSRIRTPIARIKDGKDGQDGQDGYTPVKGVDYFDGEDGANGTDGITPHIGENGNWHIGETDTGVPAEGQPGVNGQDGYTPVKGVDYFDGEDGNDGQNGADGVTPHIGENGNWYIGITDTGIPATGVDGQDGADGTNGKEVELSTNSGYIVWRYVGESTWNNLFEIPECECEGAEQIKKYGESRFGYLYNWWAINDNRNITPEGWHVPTVDEWAEMMNYLGANETGSGIHRQWEYVSDKLIEQNYTYWDESYFYYQTTNSAGLTVRGSGSRWGYDGAFAFLKIRAEFGVSQNTDGYFGIHFFVPETNDYKVDLMSEGLKPDGISLRYIKDDEVDTGYMTGNDGKVYRTIKIGDQVWLAENVAETKYRNGDAIPGPTWTNSAWAALTSDAYCIYDDDDENGWQEGNIDTVFNNFITRILQNSHHNRLNGLQGGDPEKDEFYHLTESEREKLQSITNMIDVHILFEEAEAMTYICPYDMKLIAKRASADIDADAGIDDTFTQYDEIEVTAEEPGLITLTFELIET